MMPRTDSLSSTTRMRGRLARVSPPVAFRSLISACPLLPPGTADYKPCGGLSPPVGEPVGQEPWGSALLPREVVRLMIQRRRRVTARVHLPLRRLALCLDCEECFEIGDEACPACGSETWTPL